MATSKIILDPISWFYDADQLSQKAIQVFVNDKLESGLSVAMVQFVFNFLKNGIKEFVCKNIFQVNFPKHKDSKVDVLTIDEHKRLEAIAEASNDINRVGIILSLYAGIRIGELCGLMWQDIDFDRKQLHIRRTMQRVKNKESDTKTIVTFLPPKSKSSQRSIPLPSFLASILKEFRMKSTGEYILSQDGHAVEPRVMQYRFQRIMEIAKIKPRSFHITRHCFSVRALENGFDIKTLSEILGHSSPIVTLKKYAHVLDEHKRKSMESMSSLYHR